MTRTAFLLLSLAVFRLFFFLPSGEARPGGAGEGQGVETSRKKRIGLTLEECIRRAFRYNLGLRQSAGVFVLLKRIGTGRIVTRSLGDAAVSCARCSAALLQLLPQETARIISEAFDDEQAGQEAAQLLVAAGVAP